MEEVLDQRDGAIATLVLNRPDRLNTITQPMLSALSQALRAADDDPEIRVIVITGAGRAFSAGLDLQDAASEEGISKGGFPLGVNFDVANFPPCVLHQIDTPTIAALNGGAAGFGMDLALGCDIRIAAQSAKLAAAFTRRGVLPESGGTWLLPRLVGWSKASEIIFSGKTLAAEECLALGLVSRVVANEDLQSEVRSVAEEIAASAPLAVQAAKRMMRMGMSQGFDEHVHHVYLQMLPLLGTEDFREGFTSFLEKRPARFQGK